MTTITFDQLVPIYRGIVLLDDSMVGHLRISNGSILETLQLIEGDDRAFEDSGIAIKSSSADLVLGNQIQLELSPPLAALGVLAKNMEELLDNPLHRVREPRRYYIIEERYAYNDATVPEMVSKYKNVIKLVAALSEAAALVDRYQAEATFLGATRLRVPINYSALDLNHVSALPVEALEHFVFEKVHKDQKTAILSTVAIDLCKHQPEGERFRFLLIHLRDVVSKSLDGYKLFASEFSYDKIKTKTEEAIGEYTNKIHKTFHDIQNQVMGVPVATVIVATQLKAAPTCGMEFWGNLAISVGATLFVLLLSVAIYNQFMTLGNIEDDLERQKEKLGKDYASISEKFLPLYKKLGGRVTTHRRILGTIVVICWGGVALTWFVYTRLTVVGLGMCL